MAEKKSDGKEGEKPVVAKTAVDLQRLKLMKLMKNPNKPILLPDRPKSKNTPTVPEFVRNVMGSSAGAGSGEFHVYRHLRRKEYSRQKFIQEKGKKELLDDEYHKKLEENKEAANNATAKRRAKRLKKKQKQKQQKKSKLTNLDNSHSNPSDTSEDDLDSDADKGIEAKDDTATGDPVISKDEIEKAANSTDSTDSNETPKTETETSRKKKTNDEND